MWRTVRDLKTPSLPFTSAPPPDQSTPATTRVMPVLDSGRGSRVISCVGSHNASSASPAKSLLEGRDTGLDLPTAVSGFTGAATLAVTNAAGVIQRRVDIDFTAGTLSVDGGAPSGAPVGARLRGGGGAVGGHGLARRVLEQHGETHARGTLEGGLVRRKGW